jgi:hypothetical protein
MQPRVRLPKTCDVRVVHVDHNIWTQLEERNEWVYFTPISDSVTIVCQEQEPVEIKLTGIGKLNIDSGCKGYSLTALLTTTNQVQANYTGRGGDILSEVETKFECCEQLGTSINLTHIELNMKLKPAVTYIEDLRYASYRISELQKLAAEQEWKRKHFEYHNSYSILMYVVISMLTLYGLYRIFRWVITRWKNNRIIREITASTEQRLSLPMGDSGSGNVVNIKIKTSNESLAMNPEAIPLQSMDGGSGKSSPREQRRSSRTGARKTYF